MTISMIAMVAGKHAPKNSSLPQINSSSVVPMIKCHLVRYSKGSYNPTKKSKQMT